MGIWERAVERLRAGLRSFVLGPAVVQEADAAWGKDPSDYRPEAYGEYIATSNPVYACANLRARLLARLPIRLYKGGERKVEVTSGRLYDLMRRVNPWWTAGRLKRMTELSWCLWGVSFWFLERGGGGPKSAPREIWWARPDRVRVVPDAENYLSHFLYFPANGGQPIPYYPWEVVWMPYDNPFDEFEGLAPLAAARLAADTRSAAMKSNRNLFQQGMQMGGAVMPTKGVIWDPNQAKELEKKLDQRFKGVDKSHKWGVFRMEVQMKEAGITPKDAEFLGLLNVTLEDACRAYGIPLDIMGGQRTYENVSISLRMLWDLLMIPEGEFFAEELTEKLLPMFPGEADEAVVDYTNVVVLQEDVSQRWAREKEQIQIGAITINEWRESQGKDPVPWGDEPLRFAALMPVEDQEEAAAGGQKPEETDEDEERALLLAPGPALRIERRDVAEYDSADHRFVFRRYQRRVEPQEERVRELVVSLFERQRDSVLDRLRAGRGLNLPKWARSAEDAALSPFDTQRWEETFAEEMEPLLAAIIRYHGLAAIEDLGLEDVVFYDTAPEVVAFLKERAQRFAQRVNETTWNQLRDALAEGIDAGETMQELEGRVLEIMGERIRSSAETIARTETVGASNGGILRAWEQSEVVEAKIWVSALIPGRTRPDHEEAHGQMVPLRADFFVGGAMGPHPGAMGAPEQDINCLCTMDAVLVEEFRGSGDEASLRVFEELGAIFGDGRNQWAS